MKPNSSFTALTHAFVLKFLENNNYTSTLESFRKEAKEVIGNEELFEQDNEQIKKQESIVQEHLFNQLQSKVENMSLEK